MSLADKDSKINRDRSHWTKAKEAIEKRLGDETDGLAPKTRSLSMLTLNDRWRAETVSSMYQNIRLEVGPSILRFQHESPANEDAQRVRGDLDSNNHHGGCAETGCLLQAFEAQ